MGTFTRLLNSLKKDVKEKKKEPSDNLIETDEDRRYAKYLENLPTEELEKLYRDKWNELSNSAEWKMKHERLNGLSESEILAEITSLLKTT